jgi:hypothetical protein
LVLFFGFGGDADPPVVSPAHGAVEVWVLLDVVAVCAAGAEPALTDEFDACFAAIAVCVATPPRRVGAKSQLAIGLGSEDAQPSVKFAGCIFQLASFSEQVGTKGSGLKVCGKNPAGIALQGFAVERSYAKRESAVE